MKSPTLLTIKDILARSATWLGEKGIASPRLDAELLLGHLLEMERLQLYLSWDRPIDEKEKENYRALLRRRAAHEPVAYITGRKEFFGLRMRVTPDVLIPRPETELLVERAIELLRPASPPQSPVDCLAQNPDESANPSPTDSPAPISVESSAQNQDESLPQRPDEFPAPTLLLADIGTGSGAIAIALAHDLPNARVIATDLSNEALEIARENARTHEVADRIDFRNTSLLEGVEEPLDLIASNPPYVAEADRAILPPDVGLFEPAQALFAGFDGLDVIRQLIPQAAQRLRPGGWLVMEIGIRQAEEVVSLFAADGRYEPAEVRKDYQKIDRIVSARRLP